MKIFYLICPIGFEQLLQTELEYKYPRVFGDFDSLKIISKQAGGIEIECPLNNGLLLNNILKLPTRILLRIKKQKCRDLPKLYNIMKKINWKEYLRQDNVEFKITAKKSRIIHTDRMEKSAIDGVAFFFAANKVSKKNKLDNPAPQAIHLRLFEDELEISLDTSGELLHKRGQSSFRGHASIRENYSSALLLELIGLNNISKTDLIDPMCGTGTNLSEAKNFFNFNDRSFAYNNWSLTELPKMTPLENIWNFDNLIGNELDKNVADQASTEEIKIQQGDLFDFKIDTTNMLIVNPPYGKRIQIKGDKIKYFINIIKHIKQDIQPKQFGIIIPRDYASSIKSDKRLTFNQNGIKVEYLIFNQ